MMILQFRARRNSVFACFFPAPSGAGDLPTAPFGWRVKRSSVQKKTGRKLRPALK
jgi:hypothetical protein